MALCASPEAAPAAEEGGAFQIAWRLPPPKVPNKVDAQTAQRAAVVAAAARKEAAYALRELRAARAEGLSPADLFFSAFVSTCALAFAAVVACLCPFATAASVPPWIRHVVSGTVAFLRLYAAATVALPAARWVADRAARAAEAEEERAWAAEAGKGVGDMRRGTWVAPPLRHGAVDWSPSALEALAVAEFGAKLDGGVRRGEHPPEGGAAA